MSNLVTIKSYPKVNLGLNVYPKESMMTKHRIMSIFLKIEDYADIIEIEESEANVIDYFDADHKPLFLANDVVIKVLHFLKERKGFEKNFRISIFKNIPLHSGLGGSSSNAGTILKYICDTYGIELDVDDLLFLALNISSDLPFFASGFNLALVTNYGDEIYELSNLRIPRIQLFPFYWDVPTGAIFDNYDNTVLNMPKNDYKKIIADWDNIEKYSLSNDLLIPALSVAKEFHKHFQLLNLEHNNKVMLTGSGSFMFKFKSDEEE